MTIPDLGHLSIHTTPDKVLGLTICNGRFEVPYDLAAACTIPYIVARDHAPESRAQDILDSVVYEAGNQLITANMKRGWQFQGKYGIKVAYSELQLDLSPFGSISEELVPAVDQGETLLQKTNMVALIIKMAFIAPKIQVEVFDKDELPIEDDGFVETMPEAGELVTLRTD
jgi:hypothetical protein